MSNSFLPQALGVIIFIALLATSAVVFSRLILRIQQDGGNVRSDKFQFSEALTALVLAAFFIWLMISALSRGEDPAAKLTAEQVVPSSILFVVLSVGIAAYLEFFRGLDLREMFGITRMPPLKILAWAAGLLICVLPLIGLAALLSQAALPKDDVVQQPLVQLFRDVASHGNYRAVAMILIAGGIVAPVCEEFLFRGFFYGVGRRFLGAVPAGFLSATLFAAFHLNLASFASLLVLAVCFTLAYERTGSLLVPMCMHALFNFTNLFVIFGQAQGWFPMQ